jgi:hypothetical protein
MTNLKTAANEDVGVELTSRARMRIHVRGVAAVPGAATSMTMVIPCRICFVIGPSVV